MNNFFSWQGERQRASGTHWELREHCEEPFNIAREKKGQP